MTHDLDGWTYIAVFVLEKQDFHGLRVSYLLPNVLTSNGEIELFVENPAIEDFESPFGYFFAVT